jgi:hypothetical protein
MNLATYSSDKTLTGLRRGLNKDGVLTFSVAASEVSCAGGCGRERQHGIDDSARYRPGFHKMDDATVEIVCVVALRVFGHFGSLGVGMEGVTGVCIEVDRVVGTERFCKVLAGGDRETVALSCQRGRDKIGLCVLNLIWFSLFRSFFIVAAKAESRHRKKKSTNKMSRFRFHSFYQNLGRLRHPLPSIYDCRSVSGRDNISPGQEGSQRERAHPSGPEIEPPQPGPCS